MELKQFRALLALEEHKSFSAAARSLDTVQSNVSTHIARLERDLNCVLVDRATNSLTEEGRIVVDRARRIESELAALSTDVAAITDDIAGTIRIGVIGTTARWLVPLLLDSLRERYPNIRPVILDATTSSLVLQLTSGRIDIAVVNTPVDDETVSVTPLFDEDPVLIVPESHEFASQESITIGDLEGHELLLSAPGTTFREDIEHAAEAANVTLTPRAEVDGMRLLASLAFSGFGAAILPASAAPGWVGGNWTRVRVTGLVGRTVGIARRRRALLSAAERAAVETIQSIVCDNEETPFGIHLVDHSQGG